MKSGAELFAVAPCAVSKRFRGFLRRGEKGLRLASAERDGNRKREDKEKLSGNETVFQFPFSLLSG
ncbi:MAG: hypothetical protein WBC66_13690, partial [Candidatus Acidiferrales bacterium]